MPSIAHQRAGHSGVTGLGHSQLPTPTLTQASDWLELTWGWVPVFLNFEEGIPVCGLVEITGIEEGEGCLGTPDELCLDWEARKPIQREPCAEDGSMNRRQLRCEHRGQEAPECSGREQIVQRPCGTEGWHGVFGRRTPGKEGVESEAGRPRAHDIEALSEEHGKS